MYKLKLSALSASYIKNKSNTVVAVPLNVVAVVVELYKFPLLFLHKGNIEEENPSKCIILKIKIRYYSCIAVF